MLYAICCTCGRALDDIRPAIEARRQQQIARAILKLSASRGAPAPLPSNLPRLTGAAVEGSEIGDILDDYHVTKICCRRTIIGGVTMHSLFERPANPRGQAPPADGTHTSAN